MLVMNRILFSILIAPWTIGALSERALSAEPVPRINCLAPHQLDMDLAPKGVGPLTLAEVYCQANGPRHGASGILVSPDGRSLAFFRLDAVLHQSRLDLDKGGTDYRTDLGTFATFSADSLRSPPAFAWATNSRRGLVLDTLPFDAIGSLRGRPRGAAADARVNNAAAATLQDGRLRVLLSVGSWVVWTQGEAPRVLPDLYPGEWHSRMVLSRDGSRVLVGRLLRTEGGMCGRMGGCTPGRPVEGILAALHDLTTGQALWTIRATAVDDYEFPTPAISQDGRYALVGLMPQRTNPQIALVSMDDGTVVQTFPVPGGIYVTGSYAMGFVRGGRAVWTSALGLTALYELASARR
jgi:hypothetical protein